MPVCVPLMPHNWQLEAEHHTQKVARSPHYAPQQLFIQGDTMKHPMRSTLAAAILASFAMSSQAADGPTVTISGFGTAALTMSDTDDAEYARPNQAAGVGKSA